MAEPDNLVPVLLRELRADMDQRFAQADTRFDRLEKRLENVRQAAIGESVPRYDGSQWYGFSAPRNTPAAIVDKLNGEINAALGDPKLKARLAELGVDPAPMTPAGFGKFMADEIEKWAKVIRTAKLKVE